MSSQPWLKFYPTDWRSDPALRMCSIAARGLWMEMLCLMHEASPRGSLIVGGVTVSDKQLAILSALTEGEVCDLLAELEDAGVFSRDDDGTIYSRKMRRDTEKAERDKANGRKGGNPSFKKDNPVPVADLTPKTKHNTKGVNPPVNPIWHVGSSISETPSVKKEASTREGDLDQLENELREAAGLLDDPSPGLFDLSPIYTQLSAGYVLRTDVLPVLRECKAKGQRGSNWAYYAKIIESKKHKNSRLKPADTTTPAAPTEWINVDDPRWPDAAAMWKREKGRDPPTVSGDGGMGWHFPTDWLEKEQAA